MARKTSPVKPKWKPKTEAEKDKEYEAWCMKCLRPLILVFTLISPVLAFSTKLLDYCSRSSMANIEITKHSMIDKTNHLVAVVTGATDTNGMGYALATKLIDSGYSVILGGRNEQRLKLLLIS